MGRRYNLDPLELSQVRKKGGGEEKGRRGVKEWGERMRERGRGKG